MNGLAFPYGAFELKRSYQKNLLRAVAIAAGLHLAVIGGFLVYNYIKSLSDRDKNVIVIRDIKSLPPPSLQNKPPTLKVEPPKVKPPAVGIPKAIPDEQVVEEVVIASQKDLAEIAAPVGEGEVTIDIDPGQYTPRYGEFVDVDEEPSLINNVKPKYPEIAYANRIEGKVTVGMLVGTDGKVLATKVVNSTNDIFNDEAVAAVKQWVFKPAIQNKKPVKFWYNAPIVFKIE
jgi:protein TonB